jgi:hypothetical protein
MDARRSRAVGRGVIILHGLVSLSCDPLSPAAFNPSSISRRIASPLHNLPPRALVDQLGALKAEIAELEVREKALRDELLRRGKNEAEGALFSVTVTNAVRRTLDTKAVKAEMGAAWWDARCRQAVVTTVAVKPRAVVAKLGA